MKYTNSEATRIQLYIGNSPIMGWMTNVLGVRALADTIGSVEIIAAA